MGHKRHKIKRGEVIVEIASLDLQKEGNLRTKEKIKGKLTTKRRGDQKYLIFGLQKRAHTGWERRREKGRR